MSDRSDSVTIQNDSESAASGRQLFHAIWELVQKQFYDRSRLVALNWAEQKHRFDNRIVDDTSAIAFAKVLLQTLGDRFTRVMERVEVESKAAALVNEELFAYNKVMAGNIGYIGISSFSHRDIVEQVRERLEGVAHCRAFVVDLRGNSGGLINKTANVLELFIDEGEICFIETPTEAGLQERFVGFTHEHFVTYTEETGKEPEKFLYLRHAAMIAGKPMVVLIDGDTASSAELFAAALLANGKDGSIIAMGTKSSGKGIGQDDVDVMGKVTVKISCLRFLSPDQQWFGDCGQTVNNGIVADVQLVDSDDVKVAVEAAARHLITRLSLTALVA